MTAVSIAWAYHARHLIPVLFALVLAVAAVRMWQAQRRLAGRAADLRSAADAAARWIER